VGGAVAIALIILLSGGGGGDDDESTTPAATAPQERGDATTGANATPGSGLSGSDGGASEAPSQRARRRAREKAESGRGARPQEQGRLGETGGTPAQGERANPRRPGAQVATITVIGGAPAGGVQRVNFPKNKRVRIIVRSNTDEVVEIPDYDLSRRVSAGGSARFYFRTSKTGLFSIELERGSTRIGVLAVG
jgi:hypothetical protein